MQTITFTREEHEEMKKLGSEIAAANKRLNAIINSGKRREWNGDTMIVTEKIVVVDRSPFRRFVLKIVRLLRK